MSDIRKFFGGGGVKSAAKKTSAKKASNKSKTSTKANSNIKEKSKKRRSVVISDDEDDSKEEDHKKETGKSTKSSPVKSRFFDENKDAKTDKPTKPAKEIKEMSASSFFGSATVKQVKKKQVVMSKEKDDAEQENVSPNVSTEDEIESKPNKKNDEAESKPNKKNKIKSPKQTPKKDTKATKVVVEEEKVIEIEEENLGARRSKRNTPIKTAIEKEKIQTPTPKTPTPIEKKTLKSTPNQSETEKEKVKGTVIRKVTPDRQKSIKEEREELKQKIAAQQKQFEEEKAKEEKENEKKKPNFRAYMSRSGPQHLGERELPEGKPNCLLDKTFVITGELETVTREDAQDYIKKYGGRVTSAVSGRTTYLIVGRDPGQSKLGKAKQHKTKILNEDDFYDLIPSLGAKIDPHGAQVQAKKQKEEEKAAKRSAPENYSPKKRVKEESSKSSTTTTAAANKLASTSPSELWVTKYKPKAKKDLIGNKAAVDRIFQWLKDFDANGKQSVAPQKGAKIYNPKCRAILITGPPGIGKSSAAALLAKELGYTTKEFNASDTRNKNALRDTVKVSTNSLNISDMHNKNNGKHVVIMDEVDGMSAGDRGGVAELIQLIKYSKVPIICIANDHSSQKIKSLFNHCHDVRFTRPTSQAIKGRLMSVAYKEGLQLDSQTMEQIIQSKNSDIRQTLNQLSIMSMSSKKFTYDGVKRDLKASLKDVIVGPFDAIQKMFNPSENRKMDVNKKLNLFFSDDLVPLMSQENYLHFRPYPKNKGTSPKHQALELIETVSAAADSYSDGDLLHKILINQQSWNLMPAHGILTLARPATMMAGGMAGGGWGLGFPSWLSNYSKCKRTDRILRELQTHVRLHCGAEKSQINQYYLPMIKRKITQPLIDSEQDGIEDVISFMDTYSLTRDDWDNVIELSEYKGGKSILNKINSKTKSSFTRTYNKEGHMLPFALTQKVGKGRGAAAVTTLKEEDDDTLKDDDNGDENNKEEEDPLKDLNIKAKTKRAPAKAKASASKKMTGKRPASKVSTSKKRLKK